MKRKKIASVVALTLALNFLQGLLMPTISWALTSGPHQPEFTSFESNSNTDMVNLITGDFTYNLPILNVPGPEGGFSMPLSYHAGIELEEEASWVGLGWSLNAGSIIRNVSQFPDDFTGQILESSIFDSGGHGYSINFLLGSYTYDSKKGSGGSVGLGLLNLGFGSQTGLSALGISVSEEGVSFSAEQLVMQAISIGIGVATLGAGTAAATAATKSIGNSAIQSIAEEAIKQTVSTGLSIGISATLNSSGNSITNINGWKFEQAPWSIFKKRRYKYYLDVTKNEYMLGSIYLGRAKYNFTEELVGYTGADPHVYNDEFDEGNEKELWEYKPNCSGINNCIYPASDMHMKVDEHLAYVLNPTSIAFDNYSVNGAGISGLMQPFRPDVGSLAFPSKGGNISKYYLKHFGRQDYPDFDKISFHYKNENVSYYDYHIGEGGPFGPNDLSDQFGMRHTTDEYSGEDWLNWIMEDQTLYAESTDYTEDNRTDNSYKNNKIAGDKYVEWYSNREILLGNIQDDFIDFLPPEQRESFRSDESKEYLIGGYSITRNDGTTFHYALPIYNIYQTTNAYKSGTTAQKSVIDSPYPVTWLLTAITGADFIDRNNNNYVDEDDWGYWTTFQYGKFSSKYTWRDPYTGTKVVPDAAGTSYSSGHKETYYLNSIQTRSHTALFVKSLRKDGKGAYSYNLRGGEEGFPSSSLKLDEIIMLENGDLEILKKDAESGGLGLKYNNGSSDESLVENTDSFDEVLDDGDLNESMLSFIKEKQFQKIKFYYSYNLCEGTHGSFEDVFYPPRGGSYGDGGKLTLDSLGILGRNNVQISPNYLFDYYNYGDANASYGPHKWDGWGMYQPDYLTSRYGHVTGINDGKEWSLKKITSPEGGITEIIYERDTYNKVSGLPAYLSLKPEDYSETTEVIDIYCNIDLTDLIEVGDQVDCSELTFEGKHPGTLFIEYPNIEQYQTVVSVSEDGIELSDPPIFSTGYEFNKVYGSLFVVIEEKPGGNLRVSEIKTTDEFDHTYKTQYIYTQNGDTSGISSGVVSTDAEFALGKDEYFYDFYDYPSTGVLYENVSVLQNVDENGNYTLKENYRFRMPDQSMVKLYSELLVDNALAEFDYLDNAHARLHVNQLRISTAGIGRIESIEKYDPNGYLQKKVDYQYLEDEDDQYGKLGIFTEGSIISERVYHSGVAKNFYKLIRTTKQYLPSILKSVNYQNNQQNSFIHNTEYDLVTGAVLSTEYENSWGVKYKTQTIPAYHKYPDMGSKVADPDNKHMVSQVTGQYLYTYDPSTNDYTRLLSSEVQTWNDDWTYREYDSENEVYEDVSEENEVWRKHQKYEWRSKLNADGSYENFVDFNWANLQQLDDGWKKVEEYNRFDHYSKPLEVADIEDRLAVTKMGYNDRYVTVSGINGQYTEIYASSAEDAIDNTNYFGGEVEGAVRQYYTNQYAHTGKHAVRLPANATGFKVENEIGASKAFRDQDYFASVWLHKENASHGELYYKIKNSGGTTIHSGNVEYDDDEAFQADDWYLLSIAIPSSEVGAGASIEVGVKHHNQGLIPQGQLDGGAIYFDDFRLHPLQAAVTSSVYDTRTGEVLATLNNDNFATRFYYDDAGRLERVERETKDGFYKARKYSYEYARD